MEWWVVGYGGQGTVEKEGGVGCEGLGMWRWDLPARRVRDRPIQVKKNENSIKICPYSWASLARPELVSHQCGCVRLDMAGQARLPRRTTTNMMGRPGGDFNVARGAIQVCA